MTSPNARRGSESLVERLLPRLYRTAHYLSRDENEAEDAVQETIARFLEARVKDPRRVRNPVAWCAAVLARLCISGRREVLPTGLDEDAAIDTRGPEIAAMKSELREQVRRRVAELPAEEREAVGLHVFGELTIREVARATGVSRSCAHERLHKGLERLRRRLDPAVLGAIVPTAAPPAQFIDALRAIPAPTPSPALTAAVTEALAGAGAAGGAASLLPPSLSIGGIAMLKGKAILIAAAAILIATTIGVGIRLAAVRRGSEPLAGRGDTAGSEAREPVSLPERWIAERESPIAAAPALALTQKDIERLLAAAVQAFEQKDAGAFRDAFLALLDAGPAAWPAVIELAGITGGFNSIAGALSPSDATLARELIEAVTQRRAKLGGLADAILGRDADPDAATNFAFDLLRHCRVESERPAGQQAAALLRILERAIEIEAEGVDWNEHVILAGEILGKLGPRAAISRLHEILGMVQTGGRRALGGQRSRAFPASRKAWVDANGHRTYYTPHDPPFQGGRALSPDVPPVGSPSTVLPRFDSCQILERPGVSETNRVAVLRAVARIGGGEAVAILRTIRDRSSPQVRSHLMNNLAMYEYGPEVEDFIQETVDLEDDSSVRSGLLRTLAGREEYRSRLGKRLNDASLGLQERLTILEALFERGTDEEKEIAWRHVEASGADLQDEVLGPLADTEPRAMDLLLRRLESEEVSEELAGGLARIDAKVVQAHRGRIERLTRDLTRPVRIRAAAAAALERLDRAEAAAARPAE